MRKCILDKAELFEENGQYYISAKYTVETDDLIKEVYVPKIKIPFMNSVSHGFDINFDHCWPDPVSIYPGPRSNAYINTGLGDLKLEYGNIDGSSGNYYFMEKIIEHKKRDMTVEEIEKKLGYKIRIVSEKNT